MAQDDDRGVSLEHQELFDAEAPIAGEYL